MGNLKITHKEECENKVENLDEKKSLLTGEIKDFTIKNINSATKLENIDYKEKLAVSGVSYVHSISQVNNPVYKLFQQKEYSLLKEHFSNMDVYFKGQTFNSHFEFKEFLIRIEQINMVELLELPDFNVGKPFPNILNPLDDKSTATTFRSNTKSIEYYAYSHGGKMKHLNLIQLIGKLINEEQQETIELLAHLFGIEINTPLEVSEVRRNADIFVDNIRKGNLKESIPCFYKIFGKDLELVCFLIETISKQEYYMLPKENKNVILSYISIDKYRTIYESKYTGYLRARSKINKFIQTMTLADLTIKYNIIDLPLSIQNIIEKRRIIKNYTRRNDVITIPNFTDTILETIENQCEIMVAKNFNMNTISKNMVISTYGIDCALKVFSQIKDNEKVLSKRMVNSKISAAKIINLQISKSNYINEKDLIDKMYKNRKRSNKYLKKDEIVWEIEQLRQTICEENNLESVMLTKALRIELNVSDKDIPKSKRPRIYKQKQ